MKSSSLMWVVIVIIVVLGGWYWFSQSSQQGAGTMANEAATMPTQGASSTAGTMNGPLMGIEYVPGNFLLAAGSATSTGSYLVGFNGMTLYTFVNDKTGTSTCVQSCADLWPPYLVSDTSALSSLQAGVKGTVGTITRPDGEIQVTYNGKPLYFYSKDTMPGDVSGQGVKGLWTVAKP